MAWEIVKELVVSGTKYIWNFPSALETAILNAISSHGNPNFNEEISNSASLHDFTITEFPFVNRKGSDGNWQTGGPYTIGLASLEVQDVNNGEYVYLTNSQRVSASYINNNNGTIVYFFLLDEANQQAAYASIRSAWYLTSDMNRISFYGTGTSTVYYSQVYNDIKNALPSPYSWESVQSISGKLGTVNLARIKDDYINDGEPVSGAAKSRFSNLKDGNKVSVLIENVLPDPAATGTDVTVKYDVPSLSSGSYTYCKLVAKKNSMPESVTDGNKIIDLDPTKASVTVKYLSGNTKYYFEIFTQDSEGHEAVSNVKSITTGEAHDVVLFTNEFNEDVLVDNWSLSVYQSGGGNGESQWNPSQFAADFLTKYNFLIGNSYKRPVVLGTGELTANNATSMTDGCFWIPIQRSIVPEEFKIEFDGKVSPQGWSSAYYNYTQVAVGCVDENGNWHQSRFSGDVPGQDWVHYELEVTNWTYGYIDYIGLLDCDGQPHWKNVKVTVG